MGQAGSSQRAEPFRLVDSSSDQQSQGYAHEISGGFSNMRSSNDHGHQPGVADNGLSSTSTLHSPDSQGSTVTQVPGDSQQHSRGSMSESRQDLQSESVEALYADSQQRSRDGRSAISRLGSRIIPNAIRRNIHGHINGQSDEGRTRRSALFSRPASRQGSRSRPQSPSLRNVGPRGITRRRSIRGPYALPRGESAILPESPPNPTFLDPNQHTNRHRFSWRRHSRLSNMRDSIASPISHLFGQPSPLTSSQSSTPPRRPSRGGFTEDTDLLHPHSDTMDTEMDLEESQQPELAEPTAQPTVPPPRNPASLSETRRSNAAIRSRATQLLRREEPTHTPLSHILHLAASALAAQISGNNTPTPNIQSLGSDGIEGPLESLLQGLQQIATSQEEAGAGDDPIDGSFPNVNFLRVFRFANPDNSQDGFTQPAGPSPQPTGNTRQFGTDNLGQREDSPERRSLTLVVVGVRSIPTHGNSSNENTNIPRLNVESLLRLPFGNFWRNERAPGSFLRREGRHRFSGNRNSVAGHPILTGQDGHRYQRSSTSSRRQSDAGSFGDLPSSLPTVLSESPPGPNPPPSTPADPGLSGASSVANTPSRRPSSASAFLPQLNEDSSGEAEAAAQQNSTFNFPRQRRRSDSEAARHRGLGSGAARRNGVVEPDDASPNTTRSWLIYVVGANLAENHPALAAPSLFTDNPTYEDMMLLSSLLGPVKPPVASEEEVASAGGLYRLVQYPGSLIAEDVQHGTHIPINENERCLICLCNYAAEEEARLLTKCKHMYHRECIDEWLTTGRNSCPLCRGEGVSNNNRAPAGSEMDTA